MAITPKAQATAARISDAAAALFLEQGFDATTILQVAEASGVATGTVLLHFGSKSELATGAFSRRIAAAVQTAVESVPAGTGPEQVSFIVGQLYGWYRSHDPVAAVLLRESLFSTGPAAEQYDSAVGRTVAAFQSICASHQLAEMQDAAPDPQLLAEGLLADYLLVLLQGLRGRFDTVEQQVKHFDELAALRW